MRSAQITPGSAAATEAAKRLWTRVAGGTIAPDQVAEAAERLCTQLRAGLGRWIGADGYRALLDRALRRARAEHPALGDIACMGKDEPATTAAVRTHGAAEVGAGLEALVAAMIELLGRIIGDEMALRLVEQIGVLSQHGVLRTKAEGGHDG